MLGQSNECIECRLFTLGREYEREARQKARGPRPSIDTHLSLYCDGFDAGVAWADSGLPPESETVAALRDKLNRQQVLANQTLKDCARAFNRIASLEEALDSLRAKQDSGRSASEDSGLRPAGDGSPSESSGPTVEERVERLETTLHRMSARLAKLESSHTPDGR